MTIAAPRYRLTSVEREPRWKRVRVIVLEGLMRRLGALNIVLLVLGSLIVGLEVVLFTTPGLAQLISGGHGVALSSFATPYESIVYLLLATMLTASAGASSVAGDVADRSITLYLSRPITPADYLFGKGAAVGLVLLIFFVVPGIAGCLFAFFVGNVSITLAVTAMGAFVGVGLLAVVLLTGLALMLSSLTRRPLFAGAAIFGVLVSAEILADLIQSATGSNQALYVSPIEDLLAVAQSLFGVTPSISATGALGVVLGIAVATGAVAYLRVQRVEVVQ